MKLNYLTYFKVLKLFLSYVWCTLFFWTFFPLLYIILSPFYLFRLLLDRGARLFYSADWIGLLNVRDAFLYENLQNPKGLTHAIPLLLFIKDEPGRQGSLAGDLPVSSIIDLFVTILQRKDSKGRLAYEKLSFYPETIFGYPYWIRDKQFKLEDHVRYCEDLVDRQVTEEEVEVYIGNYNSKPFPAKFPPWEVLIFKMKSSNESLTKNGGGGGGQKTYGLYFRFHHVLMDAFSIAQMGNLIDSKATSDKLKTIRVQATWKSRLVLAIKFLLFVGYDLVKLLIVNIDRNVWKLPVRELTTKTHMISSQPMDYELARVASKRHQVSPTAVLFGAIAGGIHNFLKSEAEVIPKLMRMGVAMPVPNHPLEGMVNYWTFAAIDMPINDPSGKSRVHKLENYFNFLKQRATTGATWFMTPLHSAIPTWIVGKVANNHMTTLMGSNFPGPKTKIKFMDKFEMESFRGYLPRLRGNSTVGVASFTYDGKIRFSLCVDKSLMPKRDSVQRLTTFVQEELVNLAHGVNK